MFSAANKFTVAIYTVSGINATYSGKGGRIISVAIAAWGLWEERHTKVLETVGHEANLGISQKICEADQTFIEYLDVTKTPPVHVEKPTVAELQALLEAQYAAVPVDDKYKFLS